MQKVKLTDQPEYDDSYSTCIETYSTLRVFSDDISPGEITKLLQIEPTDAFRKGDSHNLGKLKRKTNGWFYSTKKLSVSKDSRRHMDLILATLEGKDDPVKKLHIEGCKIDITTYWVSVGQGGPSLMHQQMLKLGTLGIEVWWDIYFSGGDEKCLDAEKPCS
jgi:uncharacterized protein DUF4279